MEDKLGQEDENTKKANRTQKVLQTNSNERRWMKMNSDDIKDQLLQKDEKTKRQKDDEQATSNEFTSKGGGGGAQCP